MKVEDVLLKNIQRNKEIAENITPKWEVGDTVRVLKGNTINTTEVKDFLGKFCEVVHVNIPIVMFGTSGNVEYLVKLGDRVEPFFEYELDNRYKSKIK